MNSAIPTGVWIGHPSAVGFGGGRGAAPAPVGCLGLELPLTQHQAPALCPVGVDVRLDLGGQLADGGQVDAEQLRGAATPTSPPWTPTWRSGSTTTAPPLDYSLDVIYNHDLWMHWVDLARATGRPFVLGDHDGQIVAQAVRDLARPGRRRRWRSS